MNEPGHPCNSSNGLAFVFDDEKNAKWMRRPSTVATYCGILLSDRSWLRQSKVPAQYVARRLASDNEKPPLLSATPMGQRVLRSLSRRSSTADSGIAI